jgi:chemotaxis protein histidine kinase CheA
MLIPMGTGDPGSLSAIDTTSLAEERITEELRKEDDRGVEQRKEMVDLKEREADEAREKAAVRREAAEEQEKKAAGEKKAVEEEKRQIAQERQNPEADQEELDRRERQNQEREEAAEKQESEAVRQREEAQEQEEFAEKKAEEAQKERESIAEDQQALIGNKGTVPELPAAGAFGALILNPNSPLGRMVKINLNDWRELKSSALNTVNTRTIILMGGKIIAIAGENRGNGAIRLVEIDGDSLELVKQGDEDISPQSLLWVNGADLYAVSSTGGNLYLSRFTAGLAAEARSSVTVHPYAAVTFQEGVVITQRADGSPLVLDQKSLAEKR